MFSQIFFHFYYWPCMLCMLSKIFSAIVYSIGPIAFSIVYEHVSNNDDVWTAPLRDYNDNANDQCNDIISRLSHGEVREKPFIACVTLRHFNRRLQKRCGGPVINVAAGATVCTFIRAPPR